MPRADIFTAAPYGTNFTQLGAAVQEILDLLSTAGFVQTADSGQIDPGTVVGAAGAISGYSVHRMNDSLQSIAPVFFKLVYGYGNSAGKLRVDIQFGTGTDGAGTLTGQVSSVRTMLSTNWSGSLIAMRSIAVHTSGFGALAYRPGSPSAGYTAPAAFYIDRSVDNNGLPTGDRVTCVCSPTGLRTHLAAVFRIQYSPSVSSQDTNSADLGWAPPSMGASYVGGVPQVFLTWDNTPKMRPQVGAAFTLPGETTLFDEFPLVLVGVAQRNYISVGGGAFGPLALRLVGAPTGQPTTDALLLWED